MSTPLNAALRSGSGSSDKPPSRREQVYRALRDELLSGTLTPWDRLAEERIAAAYDVSRTPVREALARLQSDGLVEKRHGGLYLRLPGFEELVHLYELRITLELQGMRRIKDDPTLHYDAPRLTSELEFWEGLRENRPPLSTAFVTSDERFHSTLLDSAGNPALTDVLRNVNQRIRPVRMHDYLTDDRMTATIEEHLAILALVLGDRLAAAFDALNDHIGESREVVMERAARALELQARSQP